MSNESSYAVAVFSPLHQTFTYLGPPGLERGQRVRVPFGSRELTGIVVGPAQSTPEQALKAVHSVPDTEPLMPASLCALAEWISQYYHAPIGQAYELCLPTLARKGLPLQPPKTPTVLTLTARGRACLPQQLRGPRQQALLRALQQHSPLATDDLRNYSRATQTALVRAELALWCPATAPPLSTLPLALSSAQHQVLSAMMQAPSWPPQVLYGATGSGKTELYIEWARVVIAAGQQCLILLPEIGLTPQMVNRFEARLGVPVGQYHSGMSEQARLRVWQQLAQHQLPLLLGTRSAVLAPFAQLGLIVVDEEHDPSYKQQDGLRYQARDVALWRARSTQCPIVLGSATPALETLHNVAQRGFQLQVLARRSQQAEVARSLIDLKRHPIAHGLSAPLIERIDEHLAQGRQVMLFLNRRGIAPSMMCEACGTIQSCPNCSAYPTYHKHPTRLLCHHCGWRTQPPYPCQGCGATRLVPLGLGTAGLAEYLSQRWPDTPIWRMDRDSIKGAHDWQTLNEAIYQAHAGILLGTQMLAKGHDFPNVTLTGIIDADSGLFSADFRAFERTAQLLTQVSGRAGRRQTRAEVLVQTRLPDHPLLNQFLEQDYLTLAQSLLAERAQTAMPPYHYLAIIRADHAQPETARQFLQTLQAKVTLAPAVFALGPMPALMNRRAGRHRMLWQLKAAERKPLHQTLANVSALVPGTVKVPSGLSWSIDVDPIEF